MLVKSKPGSPANSTSISEATPLVKSAPKVEAVPILIRITPQAFHPYIELVRLDKPNGIWLMVFPYVMGVSFGAYRIDLPPKDFFINLAIAVFSAVYVRSAGCAINDITDRKIDAGVERTKNRPMANGRISVAGGYIFLSILWLVGTFVFRHLYSSNDLAYKLFMLQMIPFAALYPWLKRVTYWPQAWLGFTVQNGLVIAFLKTSNVTDWPMMVSWLVGGTCWTLLLDTIYACQDKEFDLKAGTKSTAILFGTWITPILFFLGTMLVAGLTVVGILNKQSPVYFSIAVGGTACNLLWQAWTLDLTNPRSCRVNFIRNGQLGWVPSIGIFVDYIIKAGLLEGVKL